MLFGPFWTSLIGAPNSLCSFVLTFAQPLKQKRSAGCVNIVNLRYVRGLQTATALLCGVVAVGLNFVTTKPLELQARSRRPPNCAQFSIDTRASQPLRGVTLPPPHGCHTRAINGYPVPDPSCTPGSINPTVTIAVLRDPAFRTACIRQQVTTAHEKAQTYSWYSIRHPANNTGGSQTCELDHLVSLELGGADTLDNIWPQCGPPGVGLDERYFKQKDAVENYLAWRVRHGEMDLAQAQKGIATNWTQYLAQAMEHCASRRCE